MQLAKAQLGVVIELLKRTAVEARARTLEYAVPEIQTPLHVVAVPLRADSSVHLVSTLGEVSPHVFVTASDAPPEQVGRVLADLEAYDAIKSRLGDGDCVPLSHEWARLRGRTAAQLLPIAVSNAASGLPDTLVVAGQTYHCLLVVFLSEEERVLRQERGLDPLLAHFESTNRDLVRFDCFAA